MNCQDIIRLVDSGSFATLTDMQRSEAQAHADSCRHCAPLWFAHSRLSALRIPPMPPELSVRCHTLAAARVHAEPRSASRGILYAVGGVIALAAAASILVADFIGKSTQPRPQTPALATVTPHAPAPVQPTLEVSETTAAATPPMEPARKPESAKEGLPLLPAPTSVNQERFARDHMAIRKVLDLYPQLVEGPELPDDQYYVVALTMRTDGKVLHNEMEVTAEAKVQEASARLTKTTMSITGSGSYSSSPKGTEIGGRVLRGNLALQSSVVSSNFDMAKTAATVQAIVRAERPDLLLPVSRNGLNVLTLFLSDDGKIQKEHLEPLRPEEMTKPARVVRADEEAADLAQEIAGKLEMTADQFGLVGFTFMTEEPRPASEPGSAPAQPRALVVHYAWPRRATDAAPAIFQDLSIRDRGIDLKAATIIVERLMPEVFKPRREPAEGENLYLLPRPTVVLTAEGEVIRTEYLKIADMSLQTQNLAPGRVSSTATSVSLTNAAGYTADVFFCWQYTAAQQEQIDKQRLAVQGR